MSDEKRAKTVQALSDFIESQRALLAHTQSDIERLTELRGAISRASEVHPDVLSLQLDQGVFKLNDQNDLALSISREVDWSLYTSRDPSPFQSLTAEIRRVHLERGQPLNFQKSQLSDLQIFVKQKRRSIVDPVLTRLASDPQYVIGSEEEEPIDLEEIRRELEREKIRELKKRKFTCSLTIPVNGNSRWAQRPNGVFIRRDEDESADVDVELTSVLVPSPPVPMLDLPSVSGGAPQDCLYSRKACDSATSKKYRQHTKRKPPTEDTGPSKPKRTRGPKSDTYKLAWSVEEQHLLEQLMEEIPDGVKNRWAKISQAMNGRRTARQVASRVQKYYEKLRKFGVDVDETKAGLSS